ncbi:ERV/ALR sulfhydryl oxidase domain-containing protein, partial [Gaertneriomyces semiglobifer]
GEVIMPKMANETARAILGRSTWHFLHVLASKYPDTPTPSDRHTLKSFISLFSQLYPCGDCARHFQQLIKEFPPDLTNRTTVVQWTCEAHNRVNVRLGKEVFDCEKVKVDCGCGPE